MADPLRRTLLAKLRGKKSKKGTTAGGYGAAAANGGREGKEKVLQEREPETRSVAMLTEPYSEAENMSGMEGYVDGVLDAQGRLVRDSSGGGVDGSAQPRREAATVRVHSVRGDDRSSGGSGFRVRVNEELPGVPLQRDRQSGVDDRDGTGTVHRHRGPVLMGQVPQGSHVVKRHFVPLPRQYSGGDSIGFGDSNNHISYHRRAGVDRVAGQTDGQHPGSKNSGTNVCLDKDLKTHGDTACSQLMYMAENTVPFNEAKDKANNHPDRSGISETNVTANGTQAYLPSFTCSYRPASSSAEENILIRNIESYGNSRDYSGDTRVVNLQSPTYFPTELEICDINMSSMCARESTLRHHSLDSEDDDYYDNEILPFYETERARLNDRQTSDQVEVTEFTQAGADEQHANNSAQETDRLRSQLKEAYYLLINAMHDIRFDGQVSVGGFIDQASSSGHSRDSLCSRSSARHVDSDSWSSGEHSPQQVSDADSLLLCLAENLQWCLKVRSTNSKSLADLCGSKTRHPFKRSTSDGDIKYPDDGPSLSVKALGLRSPEAGAFEDGAGKPLVAPPPFQERAADDGTSSDDPLRDAGDDGRLNESSGSVNSLTGSSDNAEAHKLGASGGRPRAGSAAAHGGVTVNKMQEWMHKGRLLSSEMKRRIEGPSPRPRHAPPDRAVLPPPPPPGQGGPKAGGQASRAHGGQAAGASPSPPPAQQSALIENVHSSCSNGRQSAGGRGNEPSPWRPPPNTITVSKKRNWLQQSSGKPHAADDVQGAAPAAAAEEDDNGHTSRPPPSPSPESLRPPGPPPPSSRPLRLHLPQVGVGHARVAPQPRHVDPAEENDADDEGEIWYNPIPEDEESEPARRPANAAAATAANARLPVPPPELQAPAPRRRPSGRGAGREGAERTQEGCGGSGSEVAADRPAGGGGVGEGSQGHAARAELQVPPPHRPALACKPVEEGPAGRTTDGPDPPNAGFSPPSSPNPAKKGSSINWSFPDKIKSPRTVRKLSMKMKKLPELSRKLSIKGTSSSSSSNNNNGGGNGSLSGQPEARARSFRANSNGPDPRPGPARPRLSPPGGGGQAAAASRNVISRYHLDSSVSPQHSYNKKKSGGASKSASKGGYLSDGDSPELVAKSGKHGPPSEGKGAKGKEPGPLGGERGGGGEGGGGGGGGGSPKLHGAELDIDAFRHYSFSEQPKCAQYISGLMSLHFYGAEDLKPPRVDSRDVYCAIQVDSVNKARTALLTCRTAFLDMDHTFNIELENAQHLKLVVFSWEPTPRKNRVCCHGTVALPALFRVTRCHQLAVKLEPRGLIYVKLGLMEQWQNSLDGGEREPQVFGVEAWRVVEREATGLLVPLLIHKCIAEIEKRGCQVVGLYRLCGSAAVKKELREAFERDSYAVQLCENTYPDINVITGVLKDYLRELPYPLITKQLYEAVLDSMARRPLRIGPGGCENEQADTEHTVGLLEHLPEVERVTLRKLLDHLKLVASHHEVNKMTCQNLAVCFGPVLLSQRQEASCHSNRVFIDSEELASALHFKKHIEVLHYLLQLWPVVDPRGNPSLAEPPGPPASGPPPPLRRRKERPQVLNLSEAELAGVLRPRAGRLDSPSNRYAGDWSCCGESYFPPPTPEPPAPRDEADYDDVPSEDAEPAEEGRGGGERGGADEGRESSPAGEEAVQGEEPAAAVAVEPPRVEEVADAPVAEEEGGALEEEKEEGAAEEEGEGEKEGDGRRSPEETVCGDDDGGGGGERILPPPCLPMEHTYQAYMKIQDLSPVLSNRVNLRDLQESIDTLIGNLERELNKNKLNVGY